MFYFKFDNVTMPDREAIINRICTKMRDPLLDVFHH